MTSTEQIAAMGPAERARFEALLAEYDPKLIASMGPERIETLMLDFVLPNHRMNELRLFCPQRGDGKSEPHCWHWDTLRGTLRHGRFEAQRMCCYCARIGLAVPCSESHVAGHGPLLMLHGSDANDAEFVA